uniref:BCatenin1 n=1 Tax=Camerata robusta TaxID=3073262 RepID=A0AA51RH32_9PLAT|nr:putative bCatenin1 [Camerata robusta]
MNDNSKMISSPQPDDPLNDKLSYTRSWQQNQYFDSGINSAIETHTHSVSSKHGYDDDLDFLTKTKDKSDACSNSNLANLDSYANDISMMTPDTPSSVYKHGHGEAMADSVNMQPPTVDNMKDEFGNQDGGVYGKVSEIDIDKVEVESAIPDLVKLIKDEDDAVVINEATMMIFQLSKSEAIDALINSEEMISCIIEALEKSEHAEAVRFLSGAVYNMSQKRHGLKVIFEANVIPCLVKLLGFTMESVLFYAITTLHNLLLYQEGGKEAVRLSGCIPKMVNLLQKNNIKFLTICTDCLQILAFNHQPSKMEILKHGGPLHLIHIIKTYDYEKLLWTATRVIKVLSVCSANKPIIIREGGIDALTNILYHTFQKSTNNDGSANTSSTSVAASSTTSSSSSSSPQFSQRLLHNCLWTLRNLSDAATRLNFDNLLKVLTDILINATNSFHRQNYQIDTNAVICAAGILSNLTCNNQFNKMTLYKINGVEAILRTIEWNLLIITSNNPSIKISNNYYPEDLLEPCICALRHISSRHEEAEAAQSAIIQFQGLNVLIKLLEMQLGPDLYHMQTHQSVLPNLFVSYYSINWSLIKAIIGLIRNLAMSSVNFHAIREKGFVWPMIVLVNRAQIDIFNKSQCTPSTVAISKEIKLLEEIIEVACGALHMLAKDPGIRAQILSIKLWQHLIDCPQQIGVQPAAYVIASLLLNHSTESVQRVAVGLLVELSADRAGLDMIIAQPFITSKLNEMVRSHNEAISTYSSAILIRVTEARRFASGPGSSHVGYMPRSSSGIPPGVGGGGYLSSIISAGGAGATTVPPRNMDGSAANDLMLQMNEMDVSDSSTTTGIYSTNSGMQQPPHTSYTRYGGGPSSSTSSGLGSTGPPSVFMDSSDHQQHNSDHLLLQMASSSATNNRHHHNKQYNKPRPQPQPHKNNSSLSHHKDVSMDVCMNDDSWIDDTFPPAPLSSSSAATHKP